MFSTDNVSATCRDPQEINSLAAKVNILDGSQITLTCPPGMILIGPNTSLCLERGEWEPDPREAKCTGCYSCTSRTTAVQFIA